MDEFLNLKNWVVVGDVANPDKYASKILLHLNTKGYNAIGMHPLGKGAEVNSLINVNSKIDALNLCINPSLGIDVVNDANELGIKHIVIQPGAESTEIMAFCRKNGIKAELACLLVALQ